MASLRPHEAEPSSAQDTQQAGCRRSAVVRDPAFQAVLELGMERTYRMFLFLEKVRYKWRRRRILVRFVVVTLDVIWRQ